MRIPVLTPCTERWNAMKRGEDGNRFCALCQKTVHNIRTRQAACNALRRRDAGEQVCVRYAANSQGHVIFQRASMAAAAAAALLIAPAALADGAVPTLTDTADVTITVATEAAGEVLQAVDAVPTAAAPTVIADVADSDCEGNKVVGDATGTIEFVEGAEVSGEIVEVEPMVMFLGGI